MVALIAAVAHNNIIGYSGDIPWRLKDDLKLFQKITKDHIVIMGRKTWDSLPFKPLKNRFNIVVTKNPLLFNFPNISNERLVVCPDYGRALNKAKIIQKDEREINNRDLKIFIIGGSSAYSYYMQEADELYISHVNAMPCGDTFFPLIDTNIWSAETIYENESVDDNNEFLFKTVHYTRTSKDN